MNLFQKYNVPGPRYTSYPTVPYWKNDSVNPENWKESVIKSFQESNQSEGISLYIHLPYCESLCTFCGCNKRITKQHAVEDPYIAALLKEWRMYLDILPEKPIIKEIHIGGGTPTFFSPENLICLLEGIFKDSIIPKVHYYSFEGHPNQTKEEHLKTLYNLGFERVSFGVQDYDETVQIAIHRVQPFENVKRVTDLARKIGYTSVGHDLIFGLPFQTNESITRSINLTNQLRPNRIAFYSYAHVPWIKGTGQRGFSEEDLPSGPEKRDLYELGRKLLEENGYVEIGMDHFALKNDELYKSMINKTLHRNFMGYNASKTQLMIGLGVSSISDSWYAFAQNVKSVEEYLDLIEKGELPIFRGHLLNQEDLIIRKHILELMCHFETSWEDTSLVFPELKETIARLGEMVTDGLLTKTEKSMEVTEKGRPFVRNICMAFDLRLLRNKPESRLFSMTV